MSVPTPDRLHQLELAVTQRVEGLLYGDHRGLLPGAGREPGDARPYEVGDDVRRIDWNVTARTGRTHIRETVADRELETTLVVDRSASMGLGTAQAAKEELAAAAAAVFGFLTQRGGNRVSAAFLDAERFAWIPPRSGRDHLFGILTRAGQPVDPDGGPVDLAAGLRKVARSLRRRGLVVVISDFIDDGDWERPLRRLAHRHDAVAVEVLDPLDLRLPPVGIVRLEDPETGRQRVVDASDRVVATAFRESAGHRAAGVRRRIVRTGAHHLPLRTDRDWVGDIVGYVAERRRMASAGRRP